MRWISEAALSDIIKEVEKGDRVLGQSQLLSDLRSLLRLHFVMYISLEVVDLMNQARQQLYTFSNNVELSFQSFQAPMAREGGGCGELKFVIPERELLFFLNLRLTYGFHCPLIWLHLNLNNSSAICIKKK